MATATWNTSPSRSTLPSRPRSQSFGETLWEEPWAAWQEPPGRLLVPWGRGTQCSVWKAGQEPRWGAGSFIAMAACTKPAVVPPWVAGEGQGSPESHSFERWNWILFIRSGAGIRAGQACSGLPGSAVSHGTPFISVKANLAAESFATPLINTPSSWRRGSAPCQPACLPRRTAAAARLSSSSGAVTLPQAGGFGI